MLNVLFLRAVILLAVVFLLLWFNGWSPWNYEDDLE